MASNKYIYKTFLLSLKINSNSLSLALDFNNIQVHSPRRLKKNWCRDSIQKIKIKTMLKVLLLGNPVKLIFHGHIIYLFAYMVIINKFKVFFISNNYLKK